jgi:hypothetical protein
LGAIAAVAYADHIVVSISIGYLYILPLAVSAIFLRREISYSLIAVCILLHDYCSPRYINPGLRIFHNLSAMLCFAFVVWVGSKRRTITLVGLWEAVPADHCPAKAEVKLL